MDSLLKELSLGLLLRNLFSGMFFVLAYQYSCYGAGGLTIGNAVKSDKVSAVVAIALVAGVTVYHLQRALFYPLVELALDSDWAKWLRGFKDCSCLNSTSDGGPIVPSTDLNTGLCKRVRQYVCAVWWEFWSFSCRTGFCRLIRQSTLESLYRMWGLDTRDKETKEAGYLRRITGWADSMHLQYTSCFCIFAGVGASAVFIEPGSLSCFRMGEVCRLAAVFMLAGLVQNWRLKSVQEYILCQLDKEKADKEKADKTKVSEGERLGQLLGWFQKPS